MTVTHPLWEITSVQSPAAQHCNTPQSSQCKCGSPPDSQWFSKWATNNVIRVALIICFQVKIAQIVCRVKAYNVNLWYKIKLTSDSSVSFGMRIFSLCPISFPLIVDNIQTHTEKHTLIQKQKQICHNIQLITNGTLCGSNSMIRTDYSLIETLECTWAVPHFLAS